MKVLFEKTTGRFEFLKSVLLWPIYVGLHRVTRKHVRQGRRQLAVFSFDHIAHNVNLKGVYELEELEALMMWMTKGTKKKLPGIALDMGANIGNHSLFFSDYFEKVVSFEPNKRTFKLLELNSTLVKNVIVYNVGVSDQPGTARLNIDQDNVGASSISHITSSIQQVIELVTVDTVVADEEKIALIKIDVEGHEYQALKGAEKTIRHHKPHILFEQHLSDFENGQSKVIGLLRDFGYKRFAIVKPWPNVSYSLPRLVKFPFTMVLGFIFGSKMRVAEVEKIPPSFYPFIVAIPN